MTAADTPLAAIERSGLALAMRQELWLYPATEIAHIAGFVVLVGSIAMLDLRLLGLFRGVSLRTIKSFMPYAIAGFVINAVTGLLFIVMQPHSYLSGGIFWAKMGFIGVAGCNAMFFETRLSLRALGLSPDAPMPWPLRAIGGVSLFSWFAVLYCGRMLPYLGTGN